MTPRPTRVDRDDVAASLHDNAHQPARRRAPANGALPTPDVIDSDFGAFEAAVQAQQDREADRLIAWAKAGASHHGYTSLPAYVDRLEALVRQLVDLQTGGAAR